MDKALLRNIPKVDELLAPVRALCPNASSAAVTAAVRRTLDTLRESVLSGEAPEIPETAALYALAAEAVRRAEMPSLRPVINATGVVLHTNLGRARLSGRAAKAAADAAEHYSTLEYNVESGGRGSRNAHVEALLCRLTGAESALVVNNNAAAVLLLLTALTAGGEVVVSRGELVEIGGSFRVPEIMSACGATLREVGTTNKTRAADYAAAIGEHTRALMKVHTSNYRIVGFTESASREELAARAPARGLPCFEALGSGSLFDLDAFGIPGEPTLQGSVRAGADAVTCSGDKLLGGPQAGILVGKKSCLDVLKRHPLLRALRVDKMTLAALETTLRAYADGSAVSTLPTLAMLAASPEELRAQARTLCEKLTERGISAEVRGGGRGRRRQRASADAARVRRGGHAAALPNGRADGAPAAARNACCRAHCARTAAALPAHPPAGGIRRARARRRGERPMKHVVIGTAGHVDHGKTALVRALTGVDTDRLAEEQRRGLTIELGFARLDFPDGSCAGVVDVPGHEKFIKTMLAGAGGVDLAMLVVAADEGFMPQTVEHLNILSLLGVRRGVVVLTKCDLADADWLAMARADLAARVKGTFLENAPVVETSAATGQGIEDLRGTLHALVRQTREKSARVPFRLPIDRVFSVDGFGTVVTGTLIEGALHVGGEAELLPSGTRSRVRNLQVHGENTAIAVAGQRVAVNLAGIKKTDVIRGDTLAEPDSVRVSRLLDVRLSCLRDSERTVENGSRVHFCHGTAARLAKVVLLDRDALAPGESAYAQLRFTEDVAAKCGDRFVIRFYSPLETIGGGIILDDAPARHKRNDAAVLSALAVQENGSGAERVLQALTALDTALPSAAQLAARLGLEETRLTPELDALLARGEAAAPMPGRFIASAVLDALWARCEALLTDYHAKNPLHAGIRAAELRQRLFHTVEPERADALLTLFVREGKLRFAAERYALADFTVRYTRRQTALRAELLALYRAADLRPERTDRVLARFDAKDRAEAERVLESLLTGGELIALAPRLCLHREVYVCACALVRAYFADHETLTLAAFRDLLGTSRDSALLVLECLDRNDRTRREGDLRRPGRRLYE